MIDFHCHLDLYPSPADVVRECHARKLYVLSVTTTPSAFEGTSALVPPDSRIRTALGLHPELAVERADELRQFERLLPLTNYVGEVGLDGSRNHRKSLESQQGILGEILRLCKDSGGKTITIHSRGATNRILDSLAKEAGAGDFILHWYLGSERQIARAAEMGCWFSVGPGMLSSSKGIAAVRAMPRDRIVPESDGPFAKIANRPLYPWDASSIISPLAELWNESEDDVRLRLISAFKEIAQFHLRANLVRGGAQKDAILTTANRE